MASTTEAEIHELPNSGTIHVIAQSPNTTEGMPPNRPETPNCARCVVAS
jgi:hypothetical protein